MWSSSYVRILYSYRQRALASCWLLLAPLAAQSLEEQIQPLLDGKQPAAALALLDQADPECADPAVYPLRWRVGHAAWNVDAEAGLKAWQGVIDHLTAHGSKMPADAQAFSFCQQARRTKADLLELRKQFADAIDLRRTIVKDFAKSGDRVAAAESRGYLGQAMVLSGDIEQGLRGLAEASAACAELRDLAPGSLTLARMLRLQGALINDMGQLGDETRLVLQEEALAIFRQHPPEDAGEMVDLLWETANTWQYHGRMDRARELALESVTLAQEAFENDPRTFWPRSFYANVLHRTGDFRGAIELDEAILADADKQLPEQSYTRMFLWKELGHARMQVQEWDKAIEAFETGLKAVDPSALNSPLEKESLAFLFDNLGCCYAEVGRTEEARKLLQEAIDLVKQEDRKKGLYGGLGKVLQRSGKFQEAAQKFDETMPDVRGSGSYRRIVNHLGWQAMTLAALTPFDAKRLTACLDELLQVADKSITECYTLPGRPSYELAKLGDEAAEIVLSLAERLPGERERLERRAFEVLESLRGVELRVRNLGLKLARQDHEKKQELDVLRARVASARKQLARMGSDTEVSDKQVVVAALRKEADEFRLLGKRLEDVGGLAMRVTVEEIAKALPKDAAALTFRVVTRTTPDPATGGKTEAKVDRFEAWVVTRTADSKAKLERIGLGDPEPIRNAATEWQAAILGGPSRSSGRPVSSQKSDPAVALRELVFDKIKDKIGGAKILVTCLDDELHKVPIELLPKWGVEKGKAMDREFRFAASLLDLVSPPPRLKTAYSLLAVGGVEYGAEGARAAGASDNGADKAAVSTLRGARPAEVRRGYVHLEDSKKEAVDVVKEFNRHFDPDVEAILGTKATCELVTDLAQKVRYLHLATHGRVLNPGESAAVGFAPMTLCELALAGANETGTNGYVGVLTGEEIAGFDMSHCELVVLSACDTYRGSLRRGHGLASLQGAFHAAGAQTVIATRWEVDDRAAGFLMATFYTTLFEGRSPREALKTAQELTRGKPGFEAVRFWAGFILTGDLGR